MPRTTDLIVLLLAGWMLGCAPKPSVVHYTVSTNSTYLCCRTIRYTVADFASVEASGSRERGVIVSLLADSLVARCGADAELPLVIANNSGDDIFIPVSRELDGNRLKLYPWRLLFIEEKPLRIAKQLQYGDLLERTDSRLEFRRLPDGKEMRLQGVIPADWVCRLSVQIDEKFLRSELNPTFYSDFTRRLRAGVFDADAPSVATTGLRFDVVYTRLGIWEHLPVASRTASPAGDSVQIEAAVPQEPAELLNSSQEIASSNVISLIPVK